ncbi:hypothetical protein B9Z45_04250 [Limnohabitans sp. 2KL-17]|uniref:AlbA family DNA-binding domain-containing protein n=1 Tax=Limnohabitans sp. 2KL-17 TaxID=1100704 RepID=UPI000DD1DF56|nr:ATP-binding protein [Limnohabitans sp. 2KL-17]PUE62535.1 hypothetical protein B9Z45_04250 [Limnohabitans sp. 2KL-17]
MSTEPLRENHRVELKRELTPELDLEKEVVAFFNSHEGGFIYIGIDKTGQRVGVTEQVRRLCMALGQESKGSKELMQLLNLKHRPSFLEGYLNPALQQNFVQMTQPDSPRSPTQKYRLTAQGKTLSK